ncbi:MAG: dNTP triphosphohydrolase [Hydrotalea sp.]|nr:dNTP triphosphohydrolase [Hydrotalea sp.]
MTDQQQYPFYRLTLSPLATPMAMVKRQRDNRDEMNYFYLTHRSAFQKDRDRVIHAISFRRLKHKTQVFIAPRGDHYRTRLTHSLEVATLTRSLARLFGLDEDLSEAIALAHDIGHPPFGHVGEDALHKALKKIGGGDFGFDHNDQALRCLMVTESRYPHFQGLNLTDQTLLNIAKHNGPFTTITPATPPMVQVLATWLGPRALASQPGLEGQLANFCDDIAYNAHDIDDGFRAGLLTLDDIKREPTLRALLQDVTHDIDTKNNNSDMDEKIIVNALTRKLISTMVTDIYHHTLNNITQLESPSWQAIIDHHQMVAGFSPGMTTKVKNIKKFLWDNLYTAPALNDQRRSAEKIIVTLVDALHNDLEWRAKFSDAAARLTAIKDYIAGMTDHFALRKFQELTGAPDHALPFSPFRF